MEKDGGRMQSHYILALHGFLGSAADWQAVEEALNEKIASDYVWIKPDLFSPSSEITEQDLQSFETLSEKLLTLIPDDEKPIFVGYSLGARVGLHLLEKAADRFKAFIFLSAHPGLVTDQEKQQRKAHDLAWSEKLQHLSWDEFLKQWTMQPVFAGDHAINRNESDFSLPKLICGLTSVSLSQQQNKNILLARHQNKIIWAVGDKDIKFCALAEELKQKKILSNYERIFDSGHRILFDQPSKVADLIFSIS